MMSSAAVLFIFSVGLHAGAVLALAVLVVARRTSSTDSSAADRIDIEALEPVGTRARNTKAPELVVSASRPSAFEITVQEIHRCP